jgi:uncharacterized protein (DUF362 family)/Pyruvate/2-oxoacid:ferredoxin oxidoreductase delta subunit
MPQVSLVRCPTYDMETLAAAMEAAVEKAGGFDPSGKTVLLKPNLLNASDPDSAVTTHPSFLRAAIRLCRGRGAARVLVGESPGWQSAELVARKTGIRAVVEEEGAEWADFSDAVSVDVAEGKVTKRFELARAAVEADILVSLPKLKTHKLLYFTGATKNLFGTVPGLRKSQFHLRFTERREFAAMIVDLFMAVKPDYAIMDAVVGMEGLGPGNGDPRHLGWMLASSDCLALDCVASALVGYEPMDIPYLADAVGRGLIDPESITTSGLDPSSERVPDFKRIQILHDMDFFRASMPGFVHRIARNLSVDRPSFSNKRCIRCSGCVNICPAKALSFQTGKQAPRVDYSKCIRCYCCHEVCPADAIRLIRRPW